MKKSKFLFLFSTMLLMVLAVQTLFGQTDSLSTPGIGDIINPPGPGDTGAFVDWWFMVVGVFNVAVIWIVGKLFPTDSGNVMKTRAVQIGLGVIVLVVLYLTAWKGLVKFDVATVVQAVIAFIVQGMTYDGLIKPLGGSTPRKKTYNKAA